MLKRLFDFSNHNFLFTTILLSSAYLLIQAFYIPYAMLSVDDFWLAYHTYHFKNGIPYLDFLPYKTVMGYYLFLIPLTLTHGYLTPLFYAKGFLVCINFIFLIGIAHWLKKFFSPPSILISLSLIIWSQFFLNYSSEIRVDLFAYWICLIGMIFILEKRPYLAGISMGIAFTFCQKTSWYIIAIDCALVLNWICLSRTRATLHQAFLFNLSLLFPILLYLLFWSSFSDMYQVAHSVFYDAYLVSKLTAYDSARLSFWNFILSGNGMLFLLWPVIWLSLILKPQSDKNYSERFLLAIFATTIMFFVSRYKQPFAYNMLATLPVFFLLYAALYDWIKDIFRLGGKINSKLTLFIFIIIYSLLLTCMSMVFSFPTAYLITGLIPICVIGCAFTKNMQKRLTYSYVIIIVTLFAGMIYPAARFAAGLEQYNGHYQKYTLNLAHEILKEGGDYLAGEPVFFYKSQPINGLQHLVVPALNYLAHPTPDLLPVMTLSSLYLTPDTTEKIIDDIKRANIKLYINNDRFFYIPDKLKQYLATQYQHFWASIYIYSPLISPNINVMDVKFAGNYEVISQSDVFIDNIMIFPYSDIYLTKGTHLSNAKTPYRLRYIPTIPLSLEFRYRDDDWNNILA